MISTSWVFPAVSAYFLLFTALTVGVSIWLKRRSKLRPPITFKLLRGPGESLRRRIQEFNDDFSIKMALAAFVPGIPATGLLYFLAAFRPSPGVQTISALLLVGVVFLVVFSFSIRWMIRQLQRHSNDRLGYMGEREVSEYLEPLIARGYIIFHDVPAEGRSKDFNLDHVVIGPTGVSVIEVKTRRKGRARLGYKDHVVTYDGSQLIWPWGEDRHGLDQARAEADWLRKWINTRTGLDIEAKAILALPGWWVEMKARGDVVVVNSKTVAKAVEGRGQLVLTADQIDLMARQLDVLCRDVEG